MIIAGAGGHAKEVLGIFAELGQADSIFFYDNISEGDASKVFDKFPVINRDEQVVQCFRTDPSFILGVGKPSVRKLLAEKLISLGGKLASIISPNARIGNYNVQLGAGLNIFTNAVITNDISIGEGTLIHINTTIHHNCKIGNYCEISPGCHLLGNVTVGNFTSIGAGSVILPGIAVGNNVIIGAGSVVTKNVGDNQLIKGVPAK